MTIRRLHLHAIAVVVLLAAGVLSVGLWPVRAAGTAPVGLRVVTTPDPSAATETITLTAVVTGTGSAPTPTGTVTFSDGSVPLGSATLDASGTATVTTVLATPGQHDLTASYSGDDHYAAATAPTTHTVEPTVSRKTWAGVQDGLWSDGANWNPPGAPANGATVVLGGGVSSVLDIPDLTLAHVDFVGTGHRVAGHDTVSELTISGTVHDDSIGGGTLDVPVVLLSGDHVVDGHVVFGDPVSGAGGIRKTGLGELDLAAPNSYEGATDLRAGTATGRSASSFGNAATGTTVAAGATARLHAPGAEPFTLAGDGASSALGALHFEGGGTHSGTLELNGSQVTISTNAAVRVDGVVSGAAELRKAGPAVLTLGASNTFSGGTDIAAGTVSAAHREALGTGSVAVAGGATLDTATFGIITNPVATAANAVLSSSVLGGFLRGALTLGGPTLVKVPSHAQSLHLNGAINGSGPLRKEGTGNWWMTGDDANTMTGTTSVTGGQFLMNKQAGVVSVPDGLTVEDGATGTVFSDNQIGDSAPVAVHGDLYFLGNSDRFGSLTVGAGTVSLAFYIEHVKTDFSLVQTDSLHLLSPSSAVVLAVDPTAGAPTAGTHHDQFRVSGTVSLNGRLFVRGGVRKGTTVTIIENTGTAPVSGTFAGLPEGATVTTEKGSAVISYRGGDGNDVTLTGPPLRSGYWMLGANGTVHPFGDARHLGDAVGRLGNAAPVDIEPTSSHNGYWMLLSDGQVFAFGDAPARGSATDRLHPGEKATSISNNGRDHYWVFTDRGRALPFGEAGFFGDMSGRALNGPVLGSVSTPSGQGYYMVASDGGVFAFGDARFRGSMGGRPLNGPVVGLAPDPDNDGYWLVATDGGIFSFEAPFRGSMGGRPLNRPVIGMVAYGDGYLMVAADGGIFTFSSRPFHGSLGGNPPPYPIVGVAPLNET